MNVAAIPREFLEVDLVRVDDPQLPSRTEMDEEQLEELADSIRAIGLQQPIIVARVGDRLEVIAGHRRAVACRRAGLARVPAIVYASKPDELVSVQYGENRYREELKAADEAILFMELLETKCGGDTDVLAGLVNEKRAYVEGRLALFQGDPQVFEELRAERITIGVAQQLNRCTDQLHRRLLLDLAIKHGATVAIVQGWISEWKTTYEPAYRNLQGEPREPSPPPPPIADPFRCALCDQTTDPASMLPVQMHRACQHYQLTPALEMWARRTDYIKAPRTQAEAVELINDLLERFPAIGQGNDARRI